MTILGGDKDDDKPSLPSGKENKEVTFISDINTYKREEMVCPNCSTKGLKPIPELEDDYSTRKAKILKATKCPNKNCKFSNKIPKEELKAQYRKPSLIEKIKLIISNNNTKNEDDENKKEKRDPSVKKSQKNNTISKKIKRKYKNNKLIIYVLLLILGVQIIGSTSFAFALPLPFGEATTNIQGKVIGSEEGASLSGVKVKLYNNNKVSVTTNPDGTYNLTKIPVGKINLSVEPQKESKYASRLYSLNVTKKGNISFINSYESAKIKNNSLKITLPKTRKITVGGDSSSVSINYNNPNNIKKGLSVTLIPKKVSNSKTITKRKTLEPGTTENIQISGNITNQKISFSNISSSNNIKTYTYKEGLESLPVKSGTLHVSNKITFKNNLITKSSKNGNILINFSNNKPEYIPELKISKQDTSNSETTTISGTISNTSKTIEPNLQSGTLQLILKGYGKQKTTKSVNGEILGNELQFNIKGNTKPNNTKLTFISGNKKSQTKVDEAQFSSTDQQTTYKETELYTATSNTNITLNYEFNKLKNPNYVNAGYIINNINHTLSEGNNKETIQIDKGETVKLWLKTTSNSNINSKTFSRKNNEPKVVQTKVSSKNIQTGDQVNVKATFENNNNEPYNTRIKLFKDGKEFHSDTRVIDANSRKTIEVGTLKFYEKGVHTLSVNGGNQIQIKVGDATVKYGQGKLFAEVYKKTNAKLKIDYNKDGSTDCEISVKETCNLPNMKPGQHNITIIKEGVTQPKYNLTYDKITETKNIKVNIGNNQNTNIKYNKTLNHKIKRNIQINSNTQKIKIKTEGKLDYTIKGKTKSPQIHDLQIKLNEQEIFNKNNVKSPKTINLNQNLNKNQNTLKTISSDNIKAKLNTKIKKTKPPRLNENAKLLNEKGETICSSFELETSCKIPKNVKKINFTNINGSSIKYQITSENIKSKPKVTTVINGKTRSFENGETNINLLKTGENLINLENGNYKASLIYSHTQTSNITNPVLIIENKKGTNKKKIPNSSLKNNTTLTSPYTFKNLSKNMFTPGENTLKVQTDSGKVNIKVQAIKSK